MTALPVIFSLYMCFKYKVNLLRGKFLLIIGILLLWNLIHLFCVDDYKVSPFPFVEVFIAYILLTLYSRDLLIRYEKVTVFLSVISIVGWIFCLLSHSAMLGLANAIGSPGARISQSLYIFSVPVSPDNVGIILRNCGFAWEPGRFSCFLLLAIFFNIIRTNLNWCNKNFLILFFALLTAQSTTGYIVFIIIIMLYYLRNKKINPICIVLFVFLTMGVLSLPFMQEKLLTLFANSQEMDRQMDELVYLSTRGLNEGYYVPQRFDGFMFQLINLNHAPLWTGEGRDLTYFYLNRHMGFQIAVSEGILSIIIQYGLIIAALMYLMLWKSSKQYLKRAPYLFFLLFLLLNFSYALWEPPLLMALWLSGYLKNDLNNKNIKYVTPINNNTFI